MFITRRDLQLDTGVIRSM